MLWLGALFRHSWAINIYLVSSRIYDFRLTFLWAQHKDHATQNLYSYGWLVEGNHALLLGIGKDVFYPGNDMLDFEYISKEGYRCAQSISFLGVEMLSRGLLIRLLFWKHAWSPVHHLLATVLFPIKTVLKVFWFWSLFSKVNIGSNIQYYISPK